MEILTASYTEQRLPTSWKMAHVTTLPKKKPVVNIQKELRPISLTPCISKVAEEFDVDGFVKLAVMNILDDNQYRAIPNSSTTMALISMLHSWSLGMDGNGDCKNFIIRLCHGPPSWITSLNIVHEVEATRGKFTNKMATSSDSVELEFWHKNITKIPKVTNSFVEDFAEKNLPIKATVTRGYKFFHEEYIHDIEGEPR